MKGCAKVIISHMSNRMRTIKSLPLIAVLFTCVVILSSAAIFASEESTPSSEVSSDVERLSTLVLPEEYKDPVYQYLASGDGVKAATYTTTDIYNLLSIALYNEGTTNTWSLPRIAYWTHLTKTNTDSIHQDLREIHMILDGSYSGTYVRPSIQEMLFTSDGQGNFTSIAQAISDFPSLTYSAVNQLLGAQQNSNYYLSQINSNLSTSWSNISNSYSYTRTSPSGSNLTSDTWQKNFYCYFTGLNSVDNSNPNVFRFLVPVRTYDYISDLSQVLTDFEIYILRNSQLHKIPIDLSDVYFETTYHGTYVYLFGFDISDYLNDVVLHFTTSSNIKFYNSNFAVVSYLPFNTYYAQVLKTAFYQESSSKSFSGISSDVSRLADYLADPDKIAAEEASHQVIDDTLDGFTGSGSAAAKGSDIGSMKNISGSVQSGLDTGAGVSNATNVFSLNGGFWGWFTQSNSDQINYPYPAPVVNNYRKSSGDEVVDFLSDNQSQVKDLLGESKW